jgi:hypothetical protein
MALSYFPDEQTVEIVKSIFEQEWASGGYGGDAWLQIVNGMCLYGQIPDAAFIDHIVDLEHNSGTVLDKSARKYTNFNTDGAYDLRKFLNYKFSNDILRDNFRFDVSRKLHSLVVRFSNIIEPLQSAECLRPRLEKLSDYTVEWDNEHLSVEDAQGGPRCAICDDKISEDDHEHTPGGECICSSCYYDNYTTCDNCDKTFDRDDLHETTDGLDLCEDCLSKKGYVMCEDCGNYSDEYVISSDGETFCNNCKDSNVDYCETCEEYYTDITWHNDNTHETENEQEEEKTPPATFPKIEKTFKIYNNHGWDDITMKVWDFPGSGLFVFDLKTSDILTGNATKSSKTKYAIMTPCGLWFSNKNHTTLQQAEQLLIDVKDIIDWTKITTQEIWQGMPLDKLDEIRKIVYGG